MSLRFIVGRSGAGKTHQCLSEIGDLLRRDPLGPPLFFLVPEQATFQMEQALLELKGVKGASRARVVSFQRLAYLIFSEVGGITRPRLGEVGKRMLLRTLVHRRRHDLTLFGSGAGQAGFTDRLAALLVEFHTYGYGPDDVLHAAKTLETHGHAVAARKMNDLALLYADYITYITDEYADPTANLTEAADKLAASKVMDRARVWVDGFAGFTPQEYRFLQSICTVAESTNVSLCIDPDEFEAVRASSHQFDDPSLFRLPLQTAVDLQARCRQLDIQMEKTKKLYAQEGKSRFVAAALHHLEKEWDKAVPEPFAHDCTAVTVTYAEDRETEVQAVVSEIQRLVHQEGYRYRDIALVARHLDTYAPYITKAFQQSHIPYFIDERRSMLFHPLVQTIVAALQAIQTHWDTDVVLRYLKTDLASVARDDVDRLENYVLKHGIFGRAWIEKQPWHYDKKLLHHDEDAADAHTARLNHEHNIDNVRTEAMRPLLQLASVVMETGTCTPRAAAVALWNFLEDIGAAQRLEQWIEQAEAEDDYEAASIHEQVWQSVVELLEQMADVLPEEPLQLEELLAMLEEGFATLRLGLIPPQIDQVLVGAIDRSRQPTVKAAFVLGLVDREFPAVPAEDCLLVDSERELLFASGVKLSDTSRLRVLHEQFYVYLALTRAAERLYMSVPKAGADGTALHPSRAIQRVQSILPSAPIRDVRRSDMAALLRSVTPEQAVGNVLHVLRSAPNDQAFDAYEWLVTHPKFAERIKPALRSLAYSNVVPQLADETTRELYGDPFVASVSRLEQFARCPFQHFAAYGLRLEERDVLRLDPSRLGVLTHTVLKQFVDTLIHTNTDWAALSDEEALSLVDRLLEEATEQLANEILLTSGRQKYIIELTRRTLHMAIRLMNEHARAGSFTPLATELRFGRPGDSIPGWELQLSDGRTARLVGTIDRLDVAQSSEKAMIRIIDYKSYNRKIAWSDIVYGLELQLIVYLGIACEDERYIPASAFYMPIRAPFVEAEADTSSEEAWILQKKALLPEGIFLADENNEVIQALDASTNLGQRSTLFPFALRKKGGLYTNSSMASEEDMERLIARVKRTATELTERIQTGDHAAQPFRRKNGERACDWCPFHAVCRFDVLIEGSEYRHLEHMTRNELFTTLREEDHGAYDSAEQRATDNE